ncbi:MAG: hypothetical protein CMJ32_06465 [Phycisphaerae bacterium]|nr:hypothetical protein [Phycisphaerae bacterium]
MTSFQGQSDVPDVDSKASRSVGSADRTVLWMSIGSLLILVTYVLIFWDFLQRQVRFAFQNPADWGHTLVIPLIALYFVYLNRDQILERPFRTSWSGLLIILAGMAWYMTCVFGPSLFQNHNTRGLGVIIVLAGLCTLFFGYRVMKYLWFPLCYILVFGQTISKTLMEKVTLVMQDVAARGAYYLLNVIGFDTDISGNTITVWNDGVPAPLNIAEACSGMRMLVAFMALGVAMAYIGLQPKRMWTKIWQRSLLVVLGIPIALFVNILRVVTLGVLSRWNINFTGGDFHHFIGLVWLIPAFLMFLGVMWVIRNMFIEVPADRQDGGIHAV